MNKTLLSLVAATTLAGIATPALADRTDKVVVEQYRDKIAKARGEPGVQQFGGAELDRAVAALPALAKRLDDNKPNQVRAATAEIDALIETARTRAKVALAKDGASAAAGATQAQVEEARAAADRASASAARSEADNARLRAEMAAYAMKQTDLGATLVLQDVVFETGKAVLKPGAEARLRPLAGYLAANPNVRVRIDGHTDAEGSDTANQGLSQARAAAVRNALGALGVDAARIEAIGHGESQPVADNKDAAGRQQNRRVEITLVGQQASTFAGT
jgi:outer membrane protein OmpA-like peptidoglycan-associated protein